MMHFAINLFPLTPDLSTPRLPREDLKLRWKRYIPLLAPLSSNQFNMASPPLPPKKVPVHVDQPPMRLLLSFPSDVEPGKCFQCQTPLESYFPENFSPQSTPASVVPFSGLCRFLFQSLTLCWSTIKKVFCSKRGNILFPARLSSFVNPLSLFPLRQSFSGVSSFRIS